MEALSLREKDVARLVALGLSNKQIANRLEISEQTVKNHLQSIFRKLAVGNRVELTLHVRTSRRTTHRRRSDVPVRTYRAAVSAAKRGRKHITK